MAKIKFTEPGGPITAANMVKSFYRATNQTYDPKKITVDGRVLYVHGLPESVLDKIVHKLDAKYC